jgi:hypothetical protein
LDNSSYAEGDNGVSSKEKEGDELVNQDVLLPVLHPENQDNTGFPCKLVSNRVTSHEYDTPIVVLLYCWRVAILWGVALTKKKNGSTY